MASCTDETRRPVGEKQQDSTRHHNGWRNFHTCPTQHQRDEGDQERARHGVEEVSRPPSGKLPGEQADQDVGTKSHRGRTDATTQDAHEDGGEDAEGHGDHPPWEGFGTADDFIQPAHGFVTAHSPGHDVRDQLVNLGKAGVIVGPRAHHTEQRDGRLVFRRVVDGHRLVGDVHFHVLQAKGSRDRNHAGLHLKGARTVTEHHFGQMKGEVDGLAGRSVHTHHLDGGVGVRTPGQPVHDVHGRRRRAVTLNQAHQHAFGVDVLPDLGRPQRLGLGQPVGMGPVGGPVGAFSHAVILPWLV